MHNLLYFVDKSSLFITSGKISHLKQLLLQFMVLISLCVR